MFKFPVQFGVPRRLTLVHSKRRLIDLIKKYNRVSNVYISVYSFVGITHFVEANVNNVVLDRAYFDFDDKDLVKFGYEDKWVDHVSRVAEFCRERDWKCYSQASSHSGGHVIIFLDSSVYLEHPKDALYNFQTYIERKCNVKCDKHIKGDINRVFRIPNTYHHSKECWCVPLEPTEIQAGVDPVEVTSKCRGYVNGKYALIDESIRYIAGSKVVSIKRFDHERPDAVYSIDVDSSLSDVSISIDIGKFPKCIQNLLKVRELDHIGRYELMNYLKNQTIAPLTPDEVLTIMKESLSEDRWRHMVSPSNENNLTFKSIYRNNYKPRSCYQMEKMGLCPEKCGRWHTVYGK